MKINLNQKVRKWVCRFRDGSRRTAHGTRMGKHWIFSALLVLGFGVLSMAQQPITKTFVKEIEVAADATVVSNTPRSMDMHMHGTMSFNNTADGFTITGKSGDLILKLEKGLDIGTWDKNVIKQTVEITVVPEDPQEAQAFLDALAIKIADDHIGNYSVDCNMNIWKMEMRNSFFSSDKAHFFLDGGKKYNIKSLQIRTILTIPKSNNLRIEGKYSGINVGDLDGELEVYLNSCNLRGGNINKVSGTFTNCNDVHFKSIKMANFSAKNSGIYINEVEKLMLGFKSLKTGCEFMTESVTNSALNEFHIKKAGEILISESSTDNFVIDEVDHLEIPTAVFSNFKIVKLNKTLFSNMTSGDLTISTINKGFESININNKTSTVILGTDKDCSYTLNAYRNNVSEFFFPKSAKMMNEEGSLTSTFLKGDKVTAGNISIRCEQCKVVFMD